MFLFLAQIEGANQHLNPPLSQRCPHGLQIPQDLLRAAKNFVKIGNVSKSTRFVVLRPCGTTFLMF